MTEAGLFALLTASVAMGGILAGTFILCALRLRNYKNEEDVPLILWAGIGIPALFIMAGLFTITG